MKKTELVFIPTPGTGHLVSTVEMAKVLVARDERLFITVLIIKFPFTPSHTQPLLSGDACGQRIRVVDLPQDPSHANLLTKVSVSVFNEFIEAHKPYVRDVVSEMIAATGTESPRIGGFVIDMFCTSMTEVADEFGLPTHVFFTSGAAFLGLMFHVQTMKDEHNQDVTELKDSDAELSVPSYANPVPAKVLPSVMVDKELGSTVLVNIARNMRKTKGILINTFAELESHAVKYLSDDNISPPIYPVGPLLNLNGEGPERNQPYEDIMGWLDNHPPSSVVFLCFGSQGSFDEEQVKEIARALERSGHRFLWSLRRPPKGNMLVPGDYENLAEVLPEGFLERTAAIGKVIGWAPQVAVLSHVAVGGFVSHCGWNSTLESLWCGVPVATWPQRAEQNMNAFQLVKELGLSVEIKLDFKIDFRAEKQEMILAAEEIESGIRRLMDGDDHQSWDEIKRKVKEMSEKSKAAVGEGGSSYNYVGCFIEDVINNAPTK